MIFSLELEIPVAAIQRIYQNSEKWWFLLGDNDFEAVFANFVFRFYGKNTAIVRSLVHGYGGRGIQGCLFQGIFANFCFGYGANASEAVQKIATDQRNYHKCSSCVITC